MERIKAKNSHDREVITNYVGELIQHDTSFHQWAPLSETKWYLISSLDDYSRRILYAELWEKESSWAHIMGLQALIRVFGLPASFYVDNHAIFRFVERRDTIHRKAKATEGTATVQWKEVLRSLNIKPIYALSPQAKGKIERSYRWIQDHLVRTCTREGIKDIQQAREVLYQEINTYNYKRKHSTTGEIPVQRFERAIQEKKTLFREFKPRIALEDIFCLRFTRTVGPYRKISFNNLKFQLKVGVGQEVELRISFNPKSQTAKIRFWHQNRFLEEKLVKAEDLNPVVSF